MVCEVAIRVLNEWVWRRKDVRLEETRDKVCGCRDRLCMSNVHVAAGKRVVLGVRESGVLLIEGSRWAHGVCRY